MPYGNSNPGPSSDMDSLYSEEEDSSSSSERSMPEKEKEVEGHTELVSKKLLGGKSVKAGDEIVLQVVKDYGEDVEVKYAPEKPDHEEAEPSGMSEDEQLSALAE